MSHPLSNETGGDSYDAMVEKDRIIKIIDELGDPERLSVRELSFVNQMKHEKGYVSPKQLLWLRDIKDKAT